MTLARHVKPSYRPCSHSIYKLSCDAYEALRKRAADRCEICGVPAGNTPSGLLHIDQDRPAGMDAVRGLLCVSCNTRLGWDPGFIASAQVARYLDNPWYASPFMIEIEREKEREGERIGRVRERLVADLALCGKGRKAKECRNEAIRRAGSEGLTQTDIVKATGLTRETIRRILNPDAAEAVREAAARKRAQKGRE